ncbi:hypothetical protein GCM10007161_19610 [Ignatzschineria indica]|uniref:Rubredoxin-like domain-containing protein n=2 Tax=Ignatzschineria TaxID=112008 RepID=A0A2U2AKZ5_9GAMM|nr:hypothetical protein [Ignatzschineria cameli]PWD85602.1 hypothetical protein DC082_00285 [Ignatzschineria indica]PWD83715.1 hypothetical protein DC077_09420 [Ignatzschineria cameli]PWD88756.1 hypothetical protein DC079_08640 [Ignatzschineria cameli]PWD89711.1 hypothetical protein DC081_08705 [Ignatzschineria cameli]PWD90600.1 hypothetical protein DC078_08640 [Ignatzschineria cameli]
MPIPYKDTPLRYLCLDCKWVGKPQSDNLSPPSFCPKCGSIKIEMGVDQRDFNKVVKGFKF